MVDFCLRARDDAKLAGLVLVLQYRRRYLVLLNCIGF